MDMNTIITMVLVISAVYAGFNMFQCTPIQAIPPAIATEIINIMLIAITVIAIATNILYVSILFSRFIPNTTNLKLFDFYNEMI